MRIPIRFPESISSLPKDEADSYWWALGRDNPTDKTPGDMMYEHHAWRFDPNSPFGETCWWKWGDLP